MFPFHAIQTFCCPKNDKHFKTRFELSCLTRILHCQEKLFLPNLSNKNYISFNDYYTVILFISACSRDLVVIQHSDSVAGVRIPLLTMSPQLHLINTEMILRIKALVTIFSIPSPTIVLMPRNVIPSIFIGFRSIIVHKCKLTFVQKYSELFMYFKNTTRENLNHESQRFRQNWCVPAWIKNKYLRIELRMTSYSEVR